MLADENAAKLNVDSNPPVEKTTTADLAFWSGIHFAIRLKHNNLPDL
jgi:hypothetical protein